MSQTTRVMTGLVAGIVIGILLAWVDQPLALRIADIVQPFGTLWLNALQMTVVPLVLALVIVGVNQASDAAHSGRVARRAISIFVVLLAAAGVMAALLAPLALSLFTPDPGIAVALRGHEAELPATTGGWAQALTAIVPSNAVAAAAAGADGLLVEMHPNPCEAWCDADQALNPEEFRDLMGSLKGIAAVIGRSL